jgi:hypothetical protein
MLERYRDDRLQNVKCITQLEMKPVREVVWVILAHFRTAVFRCEQHELGNPRLPHVFPGLVEGYARSSGRVICIVRKGRFRDVPRTLMEFDEEPILALRVTGTSHSPLSAGVESISSDRSPFAVA